MQRNEVLYSYSSGGSEMIDSKKQFSIVYFRKVTLGRTHRFIAFRNTETTTTSRASFLYREFNTSVSTYYPCRRNSFRDCALGFVLVNCMETIMLAIVYLIYI